MPLKISQSASAPPGKQLSLFSARYKEDNSQKSNMVSVRFIFAIFLIALIASFGVDAGYRKPPFNGSIFGKRANSATDYEVLSRAMSNMCEFASESCSAWLMHQDSN